MAALALLAVGTTACGSPSARAASTSSTTTTTRAVCSPSTGFLTPESKFGTTVTAPPDPSTTVPTERGARHIDAENDAGQAVIIAIDGHLAPQWLVANVNLPITWTNLSGKSEQIDFDDAPVRSPVIPPGGTFTWTSPGFGVSLTYHTVNCIEGRLTLQNPNINP